MKNIKFSKVYSKTDINRLRRNSKNKDEPTYLIFGSPWSQPSSYIYSKINVEENEDPGIQVGWVDLFENPEIFDLFKIKHVPSCIKIENGEFSETLEYNQLLYNELGL